MKGDADFDPLLEVIYSRWKVHKRVSGASRPYDFPVTCEVILDKCSQELFYAGFTKGVP
jgi:hypothetical protein